jgi:hypothetical protein
MAKEQSGPNQASAGPTPASSEPDSSDEKPPKPPPYNPDFNLIRWLPDTTEEVTGDDP